MTIGKVALVFVLVAMLGVATVTSGAAQSSCPAGFTLTTGGVAAADLNGDGFTCVRTTTNADGSTVVEALDNVAPAAGSLGCPPNFTPGGLAMDSTTDRNGDGTVCTMITPNKQTIVIDNNVKQLPTPN